MFDLTNAGLNIWEPYTVEPPYILDGEGVKIFDTAVPEDVQILRAIGAEKMRLDGVEYIESKK